MLEKIKETLNAMSLTNKKSLSEIKLIDAIKTDHDDLKELDDLLKDGSVGFSEKKKIYAEFEALLKSHSAAEERAVYGPCRKIAETRALSLEGAEEHHLADAMMEKIRTTRSPELWMARVKVLCELVEHHLKEEERDFLRQIEKKFSDEERARMARHFLNLRQKSQVLLHDDNAGILAELH